MKIAVQINGKTRGIMELDVGSNKETIIKKILSPIAQIELKTPSLMQKAP